MQTPENIINSVGDCYGFSTGVLISKRRGTALCEARSMAIYLCHKYSRRSKQEVAAIFNQKHSSINSALTKFRKNIPSNKEIMKILKQIEKNLGV